MKNLMFGVVLAMLVSNIAAEDIKLITIADLDVRASYSSVTGSDASWSGTANLFALPAKRLRELLKKKHSFFTGGTISSRWVGNTRSMTVWTLSSPETHDIILI